MVRLVSRPGDASANQGATSEYALCCMGPMSTCQQYAGAGAGWFGCPITQWRQVSGHPAVARLSRVLLPPLDARVANSTAGPATPQIGLECVWKRCWPLVAWIRPPSANQRGQTGHVPPVRDSASAIKNSSCKPMLMSCLPRMPGSSPTRDRRWVSPHPARQPVKTICEVLTFVPVPPLTRPPSPIFNPPRYPTPRPQAGFSCGHRASQIIIPPSCARSLDPGPGWPLAGGVRSASQPCANVRCGRVAPRP
jgi:hypothetical protein